MRGPGLGRRLFVALQYVLPQRALSALVYRLARCEWRWLKNLLIRLFVRGYRPAVAEADPPEPLAYPSFNAFFTRPLRAGVRPKHAAPDCIASPVDGTISQLGRIDGQRLFQAKGHHYTLDALLATHGDWAAQLRDGLFATIYLAPYDYHRIHMPVAGRLLEAWHVPGSRFSVNAATAAGVPGLFARNERVVCAFAGEHGPFVVVLVGALFVGSMNTVWHGEVRGQGRCQVTPLPLDRPLVPLQQPALAELGRFNMGSTVIVLFGAHACRWLEGMDSGSVLRVGQPLGELLVDGVSVPA